MPDSGLQARVRKLTWLCLLLWLLVTMVPLWAARHPHWQLWGWPLDFWMAAQGCVLVYLMIVASFALVVNRWEREAGTSSFSLPPGQED